MSGISVKNINLPWNHADHYFISIYDKSGPVSPDLRQILQSAGMESGADHGMTIRAPRQWKPAWDKVYAALQQANAQNRVEVAIVAGTEVSERAPAERKPPAAIATLADNLWLGDALLEGRIMCYLQPVVSAREKVFGYESFVRVRGEDGSIIAGGPIVAASKALGIEYAIDRHLHVQAIKTFVSSAFNGFLFVNFFPGFIHRPAVYLEGLSETAKNYGIIAKHIVLDFTKAESPRDIAQFKSVCDYGRSRGYSIALDDIGSLDGAIKLLEIRPDFVKIDMHLIRRVEEPAQRDIIRQIIELVHATGGTVIGEGVETDTVYLALKQLGVDLFQGYLFSPPMPVEAVMTRSTGTV